MTAVRSGIWPGEATVEVSNYKSRMTELSTEGDCLMWGGRIVIPASLREEVKKELHVGHAGCVRMKQLARRYVWWPGLDKELEELARACPGCTEKRAAPPHSPVHPWERTSGP